MDPRTHLKLDPAWVGAPHALSPGRAEAHLDTNPSMAADEQGLVHGGFIFSLADAAAMWAVNEPTVVLAGAETRFLKPVVAGARLVARARVVGSQGRRHEVEVEVRAGDQAVFTGRFRCVVPDRHVLEGRQA